VSHRSAGLESRSSSEEPQTEAPAYGFLGKEGRPAVLIEKRVALERPGAGHGSPSVAAGDRGRLRGEEVGGVAIATMLGGCGGRVEDIRYMATYAYVDERRLTPDGLLTLDPHTVIVE
jgi:hypothetical protein